MKILLESFVQALPDATLLADVEGRIVIANPSAYYLLGYPPGLLEGLSIEVLVPERFRDKHRGKREAFSSALGTRKMGEAAYLPARRYDGSELPVDISIGRFLPPESSGPLLVVTLVDRASKVEFEGELVRLANIDPLTSLQSRRYFLEVAELEFSRFRRHHNPVAIVYFDLDHFKLVNDTYGHIIGDYLLKQVGVTCRKLFRTNDSVGRIGGEEFAALLPDTNLLGAEIVAERLLTLFNEIEIDAADKGIVKTTASFGVSEFRESDTNLEMVFSRADKALYQAKRDGRNRVCVSE